jgi:hypothetical protein
MTTIPPSGRHSLARGYRAVWTMLAAAVYVVGGLTVIQQIAWQATLAVFLPAALLAGSCTLSLEAVTTERLTLSRAVRIGTQVGLVVVVAVGLTRLLGGPGLALLVGVHLFSPATPGRIERFLDRRAHSPRPAPEQLPEPSWVPPGDDLGTVQLDVPAYMSDEDLCLAWESSTLALRQCRSVEARAGIVSARQACIDELERRQPQALRQWLAAGGDPDTSPARFLAR